MLYLNSVRHALGLRSALVVACGAASFLSPVAQAAQDMAAPVVVTATREAQAINRVLADVSVISREDIERRGASNAVDLVRGLPGFEIVRNGGPASMSSVFLRGAESRHLLVLIDGVRVDTQSASGGASWEAIAAAQIDHIEVVRGPASAIYGSDAMAGVVQIFTRSGQGPAKLDLGLGVGSLGLVSADGQLSGSDGGWSYSAALASDCASGFNTKPNAAPGSVNADDDGYQSSSASARVGYRFSERQSVQVSVLSQHINGDYDASSKPTKSDASIHDLDTASAVWAAQWLDTWRSTVTVGQSNDRYETRPAPYITRTEVKNASWANQFAWGNHTFRTTLEGREDRLLNSALTAAPTSGEGTRRDGALGLGYDWQHQGYAVQSAIREDHDSQFGTYVTGSVAGGYDVSKQWRARASWGTGFRAPTLYERYTVYGQPGLLPEASRTSEVGLRYHEGSTQFGLTVYDSHVRNLIQFSTPGVCLNAKNCYRNVSVAELKGLEISGAVSLSAVRLSGSLNLDTPKNTQTDKLLARRARQHGVVRVEAAVAQWTLGGQMLASGKRYNDDKNLLPMGGYVVWGLDAQTLLTPEVKLVLRIDNVSDRSYQTALDYASSPRTFFVGLRWTPSL